MVNEAEKVSGQGQGRNGAGDQMINRDRLQKRANGREQARELLSLAELKDSETIDAFIDEIESTLRPEQVAARVEGERRRLSELAASSLEFGAHAGKRLDDVPREYLDWLVGSMEETIETVRGYLEASAHLH